MRITRKRPWSELRAAVLADLARALPADDFEASGDEEPACVSWTDGPSFSTVSAAIGSPPGWTVASWPDFLPPPEPAPGRPSPLLLLRRRFGDDALAVAVVRFAASNVRPFDSTNAAHHAPMTAIVDVDDPANCGYPLVARVARMLLDESGPRLPGSDVNPADRLSHALSEAGYETLWNRAWLDAAL